MRRTIAWLCTAAPFVAGAVAAFGARHDLRILWMAVVATLVVRAVFAATARQRGVGFAATVAFTSASAATAGVAVFAGAHDAFGVIAVAVVVAAFATAGAALGASARGRSPG